MRPAYEDIANLAMLDSHGSQSLLSSDGRTQANGKRGSSQNVLNVGKGGAATLSRRDSMISTLSKKSSLSPTIHMKNDRKKSGKVFDLKIKEKP